MGLIKSAIKTLSGGISDQFLEVIEPDNMNESTLLVSGVPVRKNGAHGTPGTVSNGSTIHVYENQLMLLVDGGKIVDYSAEPGFFTVENSSLPSAFNGGMGEAMNEAFARFRFGGVTPGAQRVYYINLKEIRGIRFGTRQPLNYFDNAYGAELFVRAHGSYSIKITNPLLFFGEVVPTGTPRLEVADINEQFMNEFLQALGAAINQMSIDGVRISHLTSKSVELSKYMGAVLDENWGTNRGMEIQNVAIASISYDEKSQELINMRNQGAMMSDAAVREGFVQSAVAKGIQDAGSNTGAGGGFVGVNMGMNAAGGMGAFSQTNAAQMAREAQEPTWQCQCGAANKDGANFCGQCGTPRAEKWLCSCGKENTGAFCPECGKAKTAKLACPECGKETDADAKFCPHCGKNLKAE